jgi:metal-responsive CopG/Arc/MetJ family transcriptional regulator
MEKKRLQFDFTDEALEVLDRLQETTGLHTRTELIRHALRFLQWAVDETSNRNATLLVERDGNVREVILPWAIGKPKAALSGSSRSAASGN